MTSPEPVPYTEYDTRLAAYCVLLRDGKVLLALWDARGTHPDFEPMWTLPGGGVELGESIEEGAVREVAEETGYEVRVAGLLGVDTGLVPAERRLHSTDRPMRTVAVFYAAEVVSGDLTHELNGSTSQAAWFPLEEVAALRRSGRVDLALELAGAGAPSPAAARREAGA